jgi:citrate lyase subunit beta/citryl-CoA lyase
MTPHANRTSLFTPGNHARRVEKALQLKADVVILDLEDAVAIAEKVATRTTIQEVLTRPRDCAVYVRVNAYETEYCYGDICSVLGKNLDGIVLPKLESAADLQSIDWLMSNLEEERGLEDGSIDLMPIIETAKGADAVRDIAQIKSRVKRLSLGGDTVFLHIKEHCAYQQTCVRARGLGFGGKLCIHPDQVNATNAVFTPTDEVITWSQKIVDEFEKAEKEGLASIQVDGYFVDYPIVEKALRDIRTIELLRLLGKA